MKLNRRSLVILAAVIAILYLLAVIFELPLAVIAFLPVVLLLGAAVLWRSKEQPTAAALPPATPVDVPAGLALEEVLATQTVVGVRLPSASADYQFLFSATVRWSPLPAGTHHPDLGSVAVDALLTRAKTTTAFLSASEESLGEHRLAALLGRPESDDRGQVQAWATGISLAVPSEDRKYLAQVTAFRRRQDAERWNRQFEQEQRKYLKDDVLATAGSATVWWLVNHPGEVEKCVELAGTLARLAAAANDLPDPFTAEQSSDPRSRSEGWESRMAHEDGPMLLPSPVQPAEPASFDFDAAVARLLDGHEEHERSLKADSLANLEARFNRPERAERIRELHDVEPVQLIEATVPSVDVSTEVATDTEQQAVSSNSNESMESPQPEVLGSSVNGEHLYHLATDGIRDEELVNESSNRPSASDAGAEDYREQFFSD